MPWVNIKGTEGQVWEPDWDPHNRKHNCADCYECQMCSDTRCDRCLSRESHMKKKCAKKKCVRRKKK